MRPCPSTGSEANRAGAALHVNKAFGNKALTFLITVSFLSASFAAAGSLVTGFSQHFATLFSAPPALLVRLLFIAALSVVNFMGITESVVINMAMAFVDIVGLCRRGGLDPGTLLYVVESCSARATARRAPPPVTPRRVNSGSPANGAEAEADEEGLTRPGQYAPAMETLRLVLLLLHLLGFAALLGGLLAQLGTGDKAVNGAMRDGAGTAFLAGLLLVGVLEAGDTAVDQGKVAVKFGVGLVILVLVMVNVRKPRIPDGLYYGLLVLTVANVAVALFWSPVHS